MKKLVSFVFVIAVFCLSAQAVEFNKYGINIWNQLYVDFNIVNPGVYAYKDLGVDDTNGPDYFVDGKSGLNLQLLTIDFTYGENNIIRGGITTGLGLSTTLLSVSDSISMSATNASDVYLAYNVGLHLLIFNSFRIETGYIWGYSFKEIYTRSTDYAWYIGISVPTTIATNIKTALIK
jgi:hypothetical protein